ncbi:MAG: hypothetical protein FJX57_06410 [Alphaproteobacteria bacterium]|nr:hypothetical protein [Alphaproteobacteria bacterium]
MRAILPVAVGVSLLAVVATLFGGLASMSRGGGFNARWGNRLMRLRVASQAVALVLLALWFFVARSG